MKTLQELGLLLVLMALTWFNKLIGAIPDKPKD